VKETEDQAQEGQSGKQYQMKRLLITGANGSLGSVCRKELQHLAETIRLGVRSSIDDAQDNEEVFCCDLGDLAAVREMVEGCDGIVHLGGQATEAEWHTIRNANIDGVFNLYEAARASSVTPRIFFASTNHTIGFHPTSEKLDGNSAFRPDCLYGVSKVFGEAMARMYFDKFGVETALVRIGSSFPEPSNHRMLSTWLSYRDFSSLVECVFRAPRLGCPIIYGVSNNDQAWWDNSHVNFLGWHPKDNAEHFRAQIDAQCEELSPDALDAMYQGGMNCAKGFHARKV